MGARLMPTYVVTGGAGFIGSNFVRLALDDRPDLRVVNIDLLTHAGNLENLAGLPQDRHTFVRADVADPEALLDEVLAFPEDKQEEVAEADLVIGVDARGIALHDLTQGPELLRRGRAAARAALPAMLALAGR